MSRLEDEDGIEGPFDRAMARAMRNDKRERKARIPVAAASGVRGARYYPNDRIANTAWEVERAVVRKAELLAAHPSIRRHGDGQPTRDYYSIRLQREDYGGGFVAYHVPWDQELSYRAIYGANGHDADSLWSYEVPPGAKEVF